MNTGVKPIKEGWAAVTVDGKRIGPALRVSQAHAVAWWLEWVYLMGQMAPIQAEQK